MALDESVSSMDDILKAFKDTADVFIGLKLAKVGGITGMKQVKTRNMILSDNEHSLLARFVVSQNIN